MSKALENKLKKQAALIKSAYELFTTEGFGSTTIRDIALRAGVAKGTFYLYFKDKFDIRDAVIRRTAGQLLQEACSHMEADIDADDPATDAADIFIYIIDYLIEAVEKDPLLVRFLSKHLSWGLFADREITDISDDGGSVSFMDYIKSIFERFGLKIRDPELLLFTLLELVSSTCHDVILYQQPQSIDEYKPYLNNCIRLLVTNSVER